MLVTQFSNADFRRFAPSWDEPARKAVFQFTVIAPQAQAAVSNMPAGIGADHGRRPQEGDVSADARRCRPISPFSASATSSAPPRNVDGVEIGVVTRTRRGARAGYALDAAEDVPALLQQLFRRALPAAQARPDRRARGRQLRGHGELGRDPVLREHPAGRSQAVGRSGPPVRLARHRPRDRPQWFGDLVTMAWWDDLWLNESFASWMENKASETCIPNGARSWWRWTPSETAMRLDATAATHPIVQPAETIDQVNRDRRRHHLREGRGGDRACSKPTSARTPSAKACAPTSRPTPTATPPRDDLWRAIEAAARKPLVRMAKDFTEQAGVPLVRVDPVTAEERRRGGASPGPLRHGRGVQARRGSGAFRSRRARSIGGAVVDQLIDAGPVVASISSRQRAAVGGQFRPGRLFPHPLRSSRLSTGWRAASATSRAIDQLGLIYDAWALGAAGYSPVANVLELISRLPPRADARVWSGALGILTGIDDYYSPGPERDAFRAWATGSLQPMFTRVRLAGPTPASRAATPILREELIRRSASLGDRGGDRRGQGPTSSIPDRSRKPVRRTARRGAGHRRRARRRRDASRPCGGLAAETNDPQAKRQFLSAMARASRSCDRQAGARPGVLAGGAGHAGAWGGAPGHRCAIRTSPSPSRWRTRRR